MTSNLKPKFSKHGTRKLITFSRLWLMVVSYDLMFYGFLDVILVLGIVGEMSSRARSITRGRSSGRGRSHGRASHHIPSMVHLEDPNQEEARGDDSVEQHAKIEESAIRDLVKEILARLPSQDRAHHGNRERSMSPRGRYLESRRQSSQSIQMKDLLRVKVKPFNGEGTGYDAENWLIALDRCFSKQDFDSNIKARLAITHLEHFAVVWWKIEEKKLGVNMQTVTWELFLEHFHERFLSEKW